MAVFGQVWRTSALMMRTVEANLKRYDLDFPGFDVLLTLRRQPGLRAVTPGELAADMMLSPAAMTNRLDRLEARELVARTADRDDRRVTRIALTASGLALADAAVETHVRVEDDLLTPLSIGERETLVALLTRIGG